MRRRLPGAAEPAASAGAGVVAVPGAGVHGCVVHPRRCPGRGTPGASWRGPGGGGGARLEEVSTGGGEAGRWAGGRASRRRCGRFLQPGAAEPTWCWAGRDGRLQLRARRPIAVGTELRYWPAEARGAVAEEWQPDGGEGIAAPREVGPRERLAAVSKTAVQGDRASPVGTVAAPLTGGCRAGDERPDLSGSLGADDPVPSAVPGTYVLVCSPRRPSEMAVLTLCRF